MDIFEYFEGLRRSLQQNHTIGFIEEPALMRAYGNHYGLFQARVFFWDGSYLTVDETIDTTAGYPQVIRYSYAYVKDNANIIRYDNAPHHSYLTSHPHHKHIGPAETPTESEPPTLNQVFKEIEQILTAE